MEFATLRTDVEVRRGAVQSTNQMLQIDLVLASGQL
jgi:hypothetical protein